MKTTPNIPIESLLESATRAPSAHNTKPWLFDTACNNVTGNRVTLYVDLTKRLPIANPDDRELYISVGCALTNFIVAAQHAGFTANVTYAPIDRTLQTTKKLVATVTLEKSTQATKNQDAQLYPAINNRFTDRTMYTNKPIPPAVITLLHDCCTDDIQLFLLAGQQKDIIANLVYTGDKTQFNEPGYRQELANWIDKGLIYHGFLRPIMSFAVRWLPVGSFVAAHEKKLIDSAPLFGVMCAKNDPLSWVHIGQVYEKIALTATIHGIHTHPMNQGLTELPAQQGVLKKLLNTQNEPLFSFRLGYPKN